MQKIIGLMAIIFNCSAYAAMCKVEAVKQDGAIVTYYRMIGAPTKYLSGAAATIKPCNAEKLEVDRPPCTICPPVNECVQTAWCKALKVSAPTTLQCPAEMRTIYDAVQKDPVTGEFRCDFK